MAPGCIVSYHEALCSTAPSPVLCVALQPQGKRFHAPSLKHAVGNAMQVPSLLLTLLDVAISTDSSFHSLSAGQGQQSQQKTVWRAISYIFSNPCCPWQSQSMDSLPAFCSSSRDEHLCAQAVVETHPWRCPSTMEMRP